MFLLAYTPAFVFSHDFPVQLLFVNQLIILKNVRAGETLFLEFDYQEFPFCLIEVLPSQIK